MSSWFLAVAHLSLDLGAVWVFCLFFPNLPSFRWACASLSLFPGVLCLSLTKHWECLHSWEICRGIRSHRLSNCWGLREHSGFDQSSEQQHPLCGLPVKQG